MVHLALVAHHLPHLAELFQQGVDLGDRGAAAGCDALATGSLDDFRTGTLFRRHREHDGLDVLHALFVEVDSFEFVSHTGHHAENTGHSAHLVHHAHLGEEVVKIERSLFHLLRHAERLLFVDRFSGSLNETHHIAHPKDASRHAIGNKGFEVGKLFPDTNKLDGLIGNRSHRKCGSASGVAVELGQDQAVQPDGIVESLGNANGLLTSGRVGNEQGFPGINKITEAFELTDKIIVHFLAACGIENDDCAVLVVGPLECRFGHLENVGFAGHGLKNGDIDLLTKRDELFYRCRSDKVTGDQERSPTFLAKVKGQLG